MGGVQKCLMWSQAPSKPIYWDVNNIINHSVPTAYRTLSSVCVLLELLLCLWIYSTKARSMDVVKYAAGVQAQINGSGTSSGAVEMTVKQFSERRLIKVKD